MNNKNIKIASATGYGRKALATLALAAALMTNATTGYGQDGPTIKPNYREADLRTVVEAVSEVTGKNFLLDPRVNAKVTLLSATPLSPDAFYETFLSILEVHGFIADEAGEVIKIRPDASARQVSGSGNGSAGRDSIVTQTILLRNVGASQLVPILRPLVAQYGHLAAHPASNLLIISDRAANVQRVRRIIGRIDQAGNEEIEVISLENASAGEVVTTLSQLSQAAQAAGGAPPVSFIADTRTNSVLVGGSKNSRLQYRVLISHLDTPNADGGASNVRYLNYADATELATKLQAQFGIAAPANGGAAAANGGISIWADEGTNALIVNAPPKVMREMMSVVDKLDIRRAQVKVEAIIVEVTEDKSAELGVTWAVDGSGSDDAVAVTNFGSTTTGVVQLGTATAGGTLDPSGIPDGVTLGVGRISNSGVSFAAILSALRGDANTNVISTPTIVTLDNQEAELKVGQEVPFVTGQFTNTGANAGAVNPFQTIQREEVGTSLKITPQINEGNGVILQIEQETSSIRQGASGAVDLITNNRSISTTVFVEDNNILVLGGLMDDMLLESEQRVPLLGKIPLLGGLFRARSSEKMKSNLMVFIRPTIIRDGVTARYETNAKYEYLRNLQQSNAEGGANLMPEERRPVLPPLPAPGESSSTTGTAEE